MDHNKILRLTRLGYSVDRIEECSEELLSKKFNPDSQIYIHALRARLEGYDLRFLKDLCDELIQLEFDPRDEGMFYSLLRGRLDGDNPDTCRDHPGFFLRDDRFYCSRCGEESERLELGLAEI